MSKINTKIKKKRKLNTADNLEKQTSGSFRCTKDRVTPVPLLYRLVYSSKISIITVFILLLSFVFQGASLTYADEIVPVDVVINDVAREATVSEPTSEVATELIEEVIEVETENLPEVEPVIDESAVDDLLIEPGATIFDEQIATTTDDLLTDPEFDQGLDSPPPLDDPPSGETGDNFNIDSESLPSNEDFVVSEIDASSTASSSEETIDEEIIDDLPVELDLPPTEEVDEVSDNSTTTEFVLDAATTTASTTDVIEEAITVTNSDTEFTFNRNECTTLASGSFYCLKAEAELLEDALFAAPDLDGDLEIYLVRDGVQSQVTSNQVDDAAPFYDQNSNTIVWHRLIDDRYQIVSYDISSGIENQLTFGITNSMEPTRQGKYTVWQNWSNNNWNIVLFDGIKHTTITESNAHDIAPYVHGSLIVWNRYINGQDKTIEMYDMISETYVTVNDSEGLSVTNPRMVFVYDSLHPNGDVVTKGYDMISRKFIQLDTLPKQLPDEIPASESTGETRALIQSKPSVKSDETIQNSNATSSGPVPLNPVQATSTEPMTLDLSVVSTSSVEIAPILNVPPMAEYELVITPLQLPVETVQE